MYAHLSYSNIPIYSSSCSDEQKGATGAFVKADLPVTTDSVCRMQDPIYMLIRLNFPLYVIAMLSFIGWMFLCFFLPTGMWGFFFDFVQ